MILFFIAVIALAFYLTPTPPHNVVKNTRVELTKRPESDIIKVSLQKIHGTKQDAKVLPYRPRNPKK